MWSSSDEMECDSETRDKLSDVLIIQAYLFFKTRDIKYAKAMEKAASLGAMGGLTTCTGSLASFMFIKCDAPLPRELLAEVENDLLEYRRMDSNDCFGINMLARVHKVLCTEKGRVGFHSGRRLPGENLFDFLGIFELDEDWVPVSEWDHAQLVSTVVEKLDRIRDNPYYRVPPSFRHGAVKRTSPVSLEPGRIVHKVHPIIENLKPALKAQLDSIALRHPLLLEEAEVYRVVTQIKEPSGNITIQAMFAQLEKFHKEAGLVDAISAAMKEVDAVSSLLLRRMDGERKEDWTRR